MTKKKIKDLGRFEVFSFNGAKWIWPDILGRDNIYECEALNGGGVLYIGPNSKEIDLEVEVLGKMVFQEKDKFGKEWVHNIYQNGRE